MGKYTVLSLTAILLPRIVSAAPQTFAQLVDRIVTIIDLAVPVLVTAAIALFMYNVLGSFGIFSGGEDGGVSREKFRTAALWGIAIIFVIVSIWGILRLLEQTLFSADSFSSSGSDPMNPCRQFEGEGCAPTTE